MRARVMELGPGVVLTGVLVAIAYGLSLLPVLQVMGMLSIALLLGIAWRATAGLTDRLFPGVRFSARTLLRLGIILLGARLDYGVIVTAGPKVLLLDAVVITAAIVGIFLLGRGFGLDRHLSIMLGVGTGICGASAVAATAPVVKAHDDDVTLAVALMGILGTLGVFLYVGLGPFIGLKATQLGILSGASLHEVAQVIAAAFTWGTVSGDLGTVVKLVRVVMLAPVLVVVGLLFGGSATARYSWREPPVPWFVIGFLLLGGINTLGWLGSPLQGGLTQASILLMAVAMAGMGLSTDLAMIRRTGWAAVAVGLLGFGGTAMLAYTLIRVLNIG